MRKLFYKPVNGTYNLLFYVNIDLDHRSGNSLFLQNRIINTADLGIKPVHLINRFDLIFRAVLFYVTQTELFYEKTTVAVHGV
jgi:hypothetical protein